MKFLPEQKNKRLWSFSLLGISILGIVYFNFFSGPSADTRRPANEVYPAADSQGVSPADPAGAGSAKPPVVKKSQGGLLPYGKEIDERVLADKKFQALKAATALVVKPEELGKDNLFGK